MPKGGGKAEVWFADPRLDGVFGPNGIQFMADGKTLLFASTSSGPAAGNPTTGVGLGRRVVAVDDAVEDDRAVDHGRRAIISRRPRPACE